MNWSSALILLFGVFISSVSQVMLKMAARREWPSRIREYLNPLVIGAYALFFGSTLLSILAYRGLPLSLGPVLEATGCIWVPLFGVTLFREKMNGMKLLALCLILGGILVSALL